MIVGNDYPGNLLFLIDGYRQNPRRAKGISNIFCRVNAPLYNVDFLIAQLVDDSLDAHTLHSDAGAYRIHIFVVGMNGNLGAHTRLSGHGFDFYGTIGDLRHLIFKETLQQARMSTGYDNLRALVGLLYLDDECLNGLANPVFLTGNLLRGSHHSCGLAEIDVDILLPAQSCRKRYRFPDWRTHHR